MRQTSTLALHNLKKAKGQFLSFGVILCLTALILNIALVLALQTFPAYDRRFAELDTADINLMIPKALDGDDIAEGIKAIDGIAAAERHEGIFAAATVREFAGSDFDMNTVFYNLDQARTLNRLAVSDSGRRSDAAYIPLYVKELGGFGLDGSITYSIGGTDYTYEIGGTVSEMQYGNYGTGLIGCYLPADVYEAFASQQEDKAVCEYAIRTSGGDLARIKQDLNTFLSDRGVPVLNVNDRIAAKQTRTMVCTLLIVIFLALAAIILAISIFLSSFRIRSAIEDELAQMGVLKAVGYTSRLMTRSIVLPYALVGFTATLLGAALSYTVLPQVAMILAVQSGFTYTPVFDPAALGIVVLTPTLIVVLFAYLSAMKIRRLQPIDAIRGVAGKAGAGQNILLAVLSIGIMVLLSFAGTLFYNVNVKPENFMNTLSEESPSVIFASEKDQLPELKRLLQADGRVDMALEYSTESAGYADGSLTAFVCEDFNKVENDICYEGRNPAAEDEIALGSALADQYPLGGRIRLTSDGSAADYTVTGYVQSVNHGGRVCELTQKGYEKIGQSAATLYVYLRGASAEAFISEYEESHEALVASSVNYEELSENGQRMYMGIVSAVVAALFAISVLMVLLVLYVIIHSMISRRRQEFGIYKAIGYTSGQLTLMTVSRFIPVAAVSALASAVAGIWYLPQINRAVFSQIGAIQNHFEISVWILLVLVIAFTAIAFLISVLLAAPIKKITVYSLLKD